MVVMEHDGSGNVMEVGSSHGLDNGVYGNVWEPLKLQKCLAHEPVVQYHNVN